MSYKHCKFIYHKYYKSHQIHTMSEGHKIKTCIIGNASVGKTSVILRIHENIFKQKTVSTTGVDYNSRVENINGEEVIVELWDTTGQDRFRNVVSNFFRGADGIFLTFDMTSDKSLKELQTWIKQLNSVLEPQVPKILIGNKCDLRPQLSEQEQKLIQKYCDENNMKYLKVSAKTGQNINKAYHTLVEEAYTYSYTKRKGKTVPVVIIKDKKEKGKEKKKCC